ncbi:hypothetical protein, partial [Enterococcus faecium]|uniref:hypothetical protein n=1 Tax=Enterococcus faecium TaxID=1352 RepID=UPI0025B1DCD1
PARRGSVIRYSDMRVRYGQPDDGVRTRPLDTWPLEQMLGNLGRSSQTFVLLYEVGRCTPASP